MSASTELKKIKTKYRPSALLMGLPLSPGTRGRWGGESGAAPGFGKAYSCAWCWRFERFLTQGDLVNKLYFSFSVCITGVKRYGFREDYSLSAFPNGNNHTNESSTLVTISGKKMRHQWSISAEGLDHNKPPPYLIGKIRIILFNCNFHDQSTY